MKKELTPRERFDLAHELEELSVSIELDAKDGEISEDDAKYRMELLERAIYAICPDYDEQLDTGLQEYMAEQGEHDG